MYNSNLNCLKKQGIWDAKFVSQRPNVRKKACRSKKKFDT